jgi:hypothetical protein
MNNYICLPLTLKLLHSITLNVQNAFDVFSERNITEINNLEVNCTNAKLHSLTA